MRINYDSVQVNTVQFIYLYMSTYSILCRHLYICIYVCIFIYTYVRLSLLLYLHNTALNSRLRTFIYNLVSLTVSLSVYMYYIRQCKYAYTYMYNVYILCSITAVRELFVTCYIIYILSIVLLQY